MNSTRWLTAMAVASCLAMPSHAQDTSRTMTSDTHRAVGETKELSNMASTYNVSVDEIRSLRDKGWSWNEVGSALAVSKRADKSLDEIVADRDQGHSWAQISEKNGFRFSEVTGEAKKVAKEGKKWDKANRSATKGGRPEPTKPGVTRGGTEGQGPEVPANNPGTDSSEELRGTPRGPSSIDQSPEGPGDNQTPR